MKLRGHVDEVRHELAVMIPDFHTASISPQQNQCLETDDCMSVLHTASNNGSLSDDQLNRNKSQQKQTTTDNDSMATKKNSQDSQTSKASSSINNPLITTELPQANSVSNSVILQSDQTADSTDNVLIEDSMHSNGDYITATLETNDESVTTVTDVNNQLNNRWYQTEFNIQHWTGCLEEEMSEIPVNIDGWRKLRICCEEKEMMKVTKDGRPWHAWKTSSRKGFTGVRRISRCKGSLCCTAQECGYLKEHNRCNKYHFQAKSGVTTCFSCGNKPQLVACPAIKVLEYDRSLKAVTVFHGGFHTCAIKRRLKQTTRSAIVTAIRRNPNVKPNRLKNNEMVNTMLVDDFRWTDIEALAEQYADVKQVQNIQRPIEA
jgi:hypothetical protein